MKKSTLCALFAGILPIMLVLGMSELQLISGRRDGEQKHRELCLLITPRGS
jgi:hypothetical protein